MDRASPLAVLAGGALAGVVVLALVPGSLFHTPAAVEDVVVHCDADVPMARAGEPLKVMVWNVQYAAGVEQEFFYDGGRAVSVTAADVDRTLAAIVERIQAHDPDILLLQELDRGSDRTARIDEVHRLLGELELPCHVTAPYHRVAYVPTPDHEHLGRVDMNLGVFSRVRLDTARRHQLALLDEPFYRRLFNLKRAVLEVGVPVEGGPDLTVLDTHLSAFSKGDGTLPKQIGQLRDLATRRSAEGRAVVLAGDLNALPPGEDPETVLEKDRILYSDAGDPMAPLYESLSPVLPLETYRADRARWFTYVPFGQQRDRTIDHVFTAGAVRADQLRVDPAGQGISDHLPLVFELRVEPGS